MDRAEATGLGVATAGHIALLAALTYGVATARPPLPKSDPIEVSFVDEVALESAAPDPSQEAPAPAAAFEPLPESAPPLPPPPTPAPPAPPVPPVPAVRAPAPTPAPVPRPVAQPPKPVARPQPPKPVATTKPARPKPAPAAKGRERLNLDLSNARDGPGKAEATGTPAAVMNAQAMAGIGSQIRRQVQPCADRMVNPGPGASRIKVRLNLKLNRNGSLKAPPSVEGVSGLDDDNRRYVQRVKEMAVAVFTSCSPLRDLPPELYAVSNGWSDFDMNYNLP